MGNQIPQTISHESLLAKSKLNIKKAIIARDHNDDSDYQIWAAIALEQLAKSSLALIHPSLIVEINNLNTLLEACGIRTNNSVIKTIGAHEAYIRLKHTVDHFSTAIFEECKKIADRRNAELHSGDSVMAKFPREQWEGVFWNASELILKSMGLTLDSWLGKNSSTPKEIIKSLKEFKTKSAQSKIKIAKQSFLLNEKGKKRTDSQINSLIKESEKINPHNHHDLFTYSLDGYWLTPCPACNCLGITGGDQTNQMLADDQSEAEFGFEIIECTYIPVEFNCPTCHLSLIGEESLLAGNINDPNIETYIQEIEFEPDYGND
jgi:hypothetical protein